MATSPEFTKLLSDMDTATTDAGNVILALRALVKTGMTSEEVAAVQATLTATHARLVSLAHDPDAPVPTPEPVFARAKR